MNLQRYVSTVYSESIRLEDKQEKPTDDAKKLNKVIADFYASLPKQSNLKAPTFEQLRKEYLEQQTKSEAQGEEEGILKKEVEDEIAQNKSLGTLSENERKELVSKKLEKKTARAPSRIAEFLIYSMFAEKIFGGNLVRLEKESVNTVVLFPVYREKANTVRLKEEIRDIYKDLVTQPGTTDFVRKNSKTGPKEGDGNLYLFIPAFSEDDESNEEYTERIGIYLDRAFDFILDEKPKQIGGVMESKKKLESILYTVDKDGGLFTDYYKKKIGAAKQKILNEKVEKFVQRLGCRLLAPLDSQKKLTKEDTIKKYREQFGQISEDTDRKYLKSFDKLIDVFLDIYKIFVSLLFFVSPETYGLLKIVPNPMDPY
jgi:hypothetical protein